MGRQTISDDDKVSGQPQNTCGNNHEACPKGFSLDQCTGFICFGDSLTEGLCDNRTAMRPYTTHLVKRLNAAGSAARGIRQVLNAGISGEEARVGRGRLAKLLREFDTNSALVLILEGTNDLGKRRDKVDTLRSLILMHEDACKLGFHTAVMSVPYLGTKTPKGESEINMDREWINTGLREFAARRAPQTMFIDLASMLPQNDVHRHLWDTDRLHLSAAGYEAMGKIISDAVGISRDRPENTANGVPHLRNAAASLSNASPPQLLSAKHPGALENIALSSAGRETKILPKAALSLTRARSLPACTAQLSSRRTSTALTLDKQANKCSIRFTPCVSSGQLTVDKNRHQGDSYCVADKHVLDTCPFAGTWTHGTISSDGRKHLSHDGVMSRCEIEDDKIKIYEGDEVFEGHLLAAPTGNASRQILWDDGDVWEFLSARATNTLVESVQSAPVVLAAEPITASSIPHANGIGTASEGCDTVKMIAS